MQSQNAFFILLLMYIVFVFNRNIKQWGLPSGCGANGVSFKRRETRWACLSSLHQGGKNTIKHCGFRGKGCVRGNCKVSPHDSNQPAAAAHFACGKMEKLQKKKTGYACLFLLELFYFAAGKMGRCGGLIQIVQGNPAVSPHTPLPLETARFPRTHRHAVKRQPGH